VEEKCDFEEDDEEGSDFEEEMGPHPLIERIAAITAEETDDDRKMWLMDSLEDFVRAQRYKVCLDDVVYRGIGDGYFFGSESDTKKDRAKLIEELEGLLERTRVTEREIHYDRLGPGGTKQISGVSTKLVIIPAAQGKQRAKKARGSPASNSAPPVQLLWTAWFDPGTSDTGREWLEDCSLSYSNKEEEEHMEEDEEDEEVNPFIDVLTASRDENAVRDVVLHPDGALGLYESLQVGLDQNSLLKVPI